MPHPHAQAGIPASPPAEAVSRAPAALGRPSRLLHWGVGAGVIGLLAYGFWLQSLPGGPGKAPFVQLHKSFGLLVFAAALARVAWRLREGFPPPAGPHPAWERRAARLLHLFLLAATLLMPLSGILRALAYARPVALFGLPVIPRLFETKQETLHALAATLHDGLALALTGALALHLAAALKHHLLDRDATLTRMLGRPPEPRP